MKRRCCPGASCRDARLEREHALLRARGRPRREDKRADDHRRRDRRREEGVDEKRKPVGQHAFLDPCRGRPRNLPLSSTRTRSNENPLQAVDFGVTKSGGSRAPAARVPSGHGDRRAPHRDADRPDAACRGEGQRADGGRARRREPRLARRNPGRGLLRLPVRARLRLAARPRATTSSCSRACASSSTPSAPRTSRARRSTILNGIQESGFKIDNPNAVSSCGCGHSFQVEEGEELPEGTEMGGCGSGCSH